MVKVVVSGVNLLEGGILSVLQDAAKSLGYHQESLDLDVTFLVHHKNLIGEFVGHNGFTILEYPIIKSSWLRRLYFEYVYSKKLSEEIKPDLWISLHDITPNINCSYRVVYCHNPSPFYKLDVKRFFYDLTFSLFCLFYKYLYQINIKKNSYVIIQQNWLRKSFKKMYGVETIVAHPLQAFSNIDTNDDSLQALNISFDQYTFFYPSFARIFKNFEVLLEASKLLEIEGVKFQVIVTLSGSENKYAETVYQKYKNIASIKFIGIQKRKVIQQLYNKVDCLVFPSKLETWGLPVSEFKSFHKPILISDLEYAHETVGEFSKIKFFDPSNPQQLANQMKLLIEGKLKFDVNQPIIPDFPFFNDWDSLIYFLVEQANNAKR